MEGLRSLLESIDGPRVVAAESSLEDAVEAVSQLQPSLVIVDTAFGAHCVMDWLRRLRTGNCRTRAIVWGVTMSESEAQQFLHAGANGVVRKTASVADLIACIRAVISGGSWREHYLVRDPEQPVRAGRPALTSRELQVAELVERGMKNKDIGVSLGICTGTVKIHIKHIFEKTGIRGRYGLALAGLRQKGLLAASVVEHFPGPGAGHYLT
jgi:two-component system, NarL family, nitrate/nitrite response regulator NarL